MSLHHDNDIDATTSCPPPPDDYEYPSVVIEIIPPTSKPEPLHKMTQLSSAGHVEVENGQCGCCLAFQLGKLPHYQLYPPLSSSTLCDDTMGLPVSFVYDTNNEFVYRSMNRKSVHADTMNTATTRGRLFKTFCDQEGTIRSGQRCFRFCVDEGKGIVVVEWTDSNNPWEVLQWARR